MNNILRHLGRPLALDGSEDFLRPARSPCAPRRAENFVVVDVTNPEPTTEVIGEMDQFHRAHAAARAAPFTMHQARQYQVEKLDCDEPARPMSAPWTWTIIPTPIC